MPVFLILFCFVIPFPKTPFTYFISRACIPLFCFSLNSHDSQLDIKIRLYDLKHLYFIFSYEISIHSIVQFHRFSTLSLISISWGPHSSIAMPEIGILSLEQFSSVSVYFHIFSNCNNFTFILINFHSFLWKVPSSQFQVFTVTLFIAVYRCV